MSSSAGMLIVYVVAFIAIFYFMAIRPQQKQRKAHQALLASLKKGDNVILASGIYGRVKRVEENLVVVEVARGISMKVARNAVAQIVRDPKEARAFAPEPTGRRGKNAPPEIEEEIEEEVPVEDDMVEMVDEVYDEEEAVAEVVEEEEEEEEYVDEEIDEEVEPQRNTRA
ncbi:MAG: preprotein translocase subunit YajC [Thermoleophilia bacterium]